MLVKEFDPAHTPAQPVNPGDSLYFLRDKDDCALRVKATVVRVLPFTNRLTEDLSHTLKEMQPRLQLTEDQYNYWSAKKQALLVEFESAQKTGVIHIASNKLKDRSDWMAFEAFNLITE
jgi:predicted glutamine amidotransferase